jgi:hypothetical protein
MPSDLQLVFLSRDFLIRVDRLIGLDRRARGLSD